MTVRCTLYTRKNQLYIDVVSYIRINAHTVIEGLVTLHKIL